MKKILISIVFILLLNESVFGETIIGKATVIDGDTIKINGVKIRLFGIDAPEKKQLCQKAFLDINFISLKKKYDCGEISTLKLKKLIENENINCVINGEDFFKRKIGICFRNKLDINSWMVRTGLAVAYIKYSKKYYQDQIQAEAEGLGLWQGDFEMPWDWRKKSAKN